MALMQKKLDTALMPHELYASVRRRFPDSVLLESAERDGRLSRYSFIGVEPEKTFTFKREGGRGVASFNCCDMETEDPLGLMRRLLQGERVSNAAPPGFMGGYIGYLSYEYVAELERRIRFAARPSDFPLMEFGLFLDGIRINNRTGEAYYISLGPDRSGEVESAIAQGPQGAAKPLRLGARKCSFTQPEFEEAVRKIKGHIMAGDIFQAVLSKQYEMQFSGDLLDFYFRLREMNPSPYMYFLKFGGRQIIGGSPENLIRVENGEITSFATLAGTRPRGRNQDEDAALERELLADPKEQAEHRMLVDLTRNDVGRVAETGTVEAGPLMQILKFSHVQHIMSQVSAHLGDGLDAFDALKAIFPAGTLSGAPKVRAMEILAALEPVARGPYGGAVGYFGFNGNADFGICIRTAVANGNTLYVQSGAGIVADSVPAKEYAETEHKAGAMMNALEASAQ
jgi:anthranilate synthase component 1